MGTTEAGEPNATLAMKQVALAIWASSAQLNIVLITERLDPAQKRFVEMAREYVMRASAAQERVFRDIGRPDLIPLLRGEHVGE